MLFMAVGYQEHRLHPDRICYGIYSTKDEAEARCEALRRHRHIQLKMWVVEFPQGECHVRLP